MYNPNSLSSFFACKITIVVKRRLKDFGAAIRFTDSDATDTTKASSVDFAPYEDKAFNIRMQQHHKGCQVREQIPLEIKSVGVLQTTLPPGVFPLPIYSMNEFVK